MRIIPAIILACFVAVKNLFLPKRTQSTTGGRRGPVDLWSINAQDFRDLKFPAVMNHKGVGPQGGSDIFKRQSSKLIFLNNKNTYFITRNI